MTERVRISRVLLVEDDEAQQFTLGSLLKREGFEVITCGTAAEALEHVQRADFGVAVVDLRLPDLAGTQLLERIRNLDPTLRVIIHTAYGSFDSARDSVNKGAFAYVEKAGDPEVLLQHVRRALREQLDRYADHLEVAVAQRTTALREANALLRREIAERRRAEEERARLETELRQAQKIEAIGTLASGVAHDFNNFLTAIIGYTDLARLALPEGSEARKALDGIEEATTQAGGVTQALLTLSRKKATQKVPVHLGELGVKTGQMLRRMLPAAIELVTEASSTADFWVEADAIQLQQVIINLAVNARDAMPNGGVLHISVQRQTGEVPPCRSATTPTDLVEVCIEDNGTGMSEEVRARVFEPFFTTKPRGRGTGLGMAIVHGIVTDHQGDIRVDSWEGKGTRITLRFPACVPPSATPLSSSAGAVPRGHGETVLVVEDNAQVLAILTSTLNSVGYEPVQAGDGLEAMTVFEALWVRIALVVLDLDLPKRNGLACLQEMRQRRPDLPVLIVTGHVLPDLGAQSGPCTRVLRKPFRAADLAESVSRLLGVPQPAA